MLKIIYVKNVLILIKERFLALKVIIFTF